MKKFLISIFCVCLVTVLSGYGQFITTWKTDNAGSSSTTQIAIPISGTNYAIYWENVDDPSTNGHAVGNNDEQIINLPTAGTYRVEISPGSGVVESIHFSNSGDALKLVGISNWGTIPWTTMNQAFYGCQNLTISARDIPDFSQVVSMNSMFRDCELVTAIPQINSWNVGNVTDMQSMFRGATNFDSHIHYWNVSNVTNMSHMFDGATNFNGAIFSDVDKVTDMTYMFNNATKFTHAIDRWNVSNVTDMQYMFNGALSFNARINGWNVANVTNMRSMFNGASKFNVSLNSWNVSRVSDMQYMFHSATAFNGEINNWNVSNVTDMQHLFDGASSFNQPLNKWNVQNVTTMNSLFYGASTFSQPLNNWDLRSTTDVSNMFELSGMDCGAITYTLQGWAANANTPTHLSLGASGIDYATEATAALHTLRNDKNWIINLGSAIVCPYLGAFITVWKTDNRGNSDKNQIVIPIYSTTSYSVYWENVDNPAINGRDTIVNQYYVSISLTFPAIGTYKVAFKPLEANISRFSFNDFGDKEKLIEITNWGTNAWESLYGAFYGCRFLKVSAGDQPNLSAVTSIGFMFANCTSLFYVQDIGQWDVSNVTDMRSVFSGATYFNQPLGSWDVSKVTNMSNMFYGVQSFNHPLNNWQVGAVTNMSNMFYGARLFNQPLDNWDVSSVINMSNMFYNATSFNRPIDNWDVSSVDNMSGMFYNAADFNQSINSWNVGSVTNMTTMFYRASNFNSPLNKWNVSNVTNMNFMFKEATSFNQSLNNWNVSQVNTMIEMFYKASSFNQPVHNWDVSKVIYIRDMFNYASSFNQSLSNWNINKVSNMTLMLTNSAMDCANITYTLQGWAANPQTPNNITLGANGRNYAPEAVDALNTLRNNKNWTITIGSEITCLALPVTLVHFKARNLENTVVLDWATTEEKEHDYFEIQRSHDAVQWTALLQINGAGTTTNTQNYTATDPMPLTGNSYYRLKMVDKDGSFEYSTTRAVQLEQLATPGFIYPNPAQQIVTFQGIPEGMVRIYNAMGQLVKQAYITPEKTSVSLHELPAGTYIIKMEQGWQQTLVKIH